MKLPEDFYRRPDPVQISRELLGKYLITHIGGVRTAGIIVETEAYNGRTDKACHAHLGRRTKRTEIMYHRGGLAYVYLTYGLHHLFNIVTNEAGFADAVLIRALEPTEGLEEMQLRRGLARPGLARPSLMRPGLARPDYRLTAGPGVMSQALGITREHWGENLQGDKIWVEDRNYTLADQDILQRPRVGIAYAQEDALLPWRFSIRNNPWVSRAKATYESGNNSAQ
ncbi:DNA-3-methyladenine glycosylase [Cesiribacter andamanensis]|uniref:Putative 3-methyladenine DNA glycosylase n=1 Tax=Cesiribacter andamanensis AMV16 TaxID=1279009 RepID=M7NB86_9BACT|nr:DNA-3-methyladenine glycosylase [Cesiribacter andamanensis]EMR04466.1 3-methyladenine DNA glycosylase [Cesiribacter andamanensis AMV16]